MKRAKPDPRLGAIAATKEIRDLRKNWLGREDSNLRMAESKSAALPLGDAPSFAGVAPARAIPIRPLALLRNMLVASFRATPLGAIDLSLQFNVS